MERFQADVKTPKYGMRLFEMYDDDDDDDDDAARMRPPLPHPKAYTKDGREIVLSSTYMGVYAKIDGVRAGALSIVLPEGALFFIVGRSMVEKEFRKQGVATAMYDFAYRCGFRPLKESKTKTDDGGEFWNRHIDKKHKMGLYGWDIDHPNSNFWRPLS